MHVAVQGCCHGSLSAIYDTLAEYEARKGQKVDLLLLCGDFQALRNDHDFASLAVPPKYHQLGTFHQFYSGERVAPVLTIVIGGNHEASNYMWELYHGGWLAPNIYYLGCAGSVLVNGLRIAGASGIYKPHDYKKGHFETVPYNNTTLRSIYHIREYDVAKLSHLPSDQPTVFLSHDWPIGIAHHGNTRSLLSRKPFFRSEVEKNTLGSPPLLELLNTLQPEYWFAAHLHVKFAAMYEHKPVVEAEKEAEAAAQQAEVDEARGERLQSADESVGGDEGNPDEIAISEDDDDVPASPIKAAPNPDEIAISMSDDEEVVKNEDEIHIEMSDDEVDAAVEVEVKSPPPTKAPEPGPIIPQASQPSPSKPRMTRFLALDKCGPGKDFIQFLDIPAPLTQSPPRLTYDPHWLAITRALHPYLSLELHASLPPRAEQDAMVADELVRIREEGVLVPEELMEDALLAEMDAELEAEARRVSDAGLEKKAAVNGEDGKKEEEDVQVKALDKSKGKESAPEPPTTDTPSREDDLPRFAPLAWEDASDIEVGRVQQFWPTAPPHPGGQPRQWYTNPQTEAFCGMLGIQNKVNPRPVER